MKKEKVCYMIDHSENDDENEKQITQARNSRGSR